MLSRRSHDFTLVLTGVSEITTSLEDTLFVGGCDDATLVGQGGKVSLLFTRTAGSRDEAIASAKSDLSTLGLISEIGR